MQDRLSRKYDRNQVDRIIRRALTLDKGDAVGYSELLETAREMGISPHTLDRAIKLEQEEIQREDARKRWLKRHRSGLHAHLWSYIIVNAALLLINLMTTRVWWFQWPMIGWGIGLAFHLREAYFPSERKMEKGIRKILSRNPD